LLYQINWLIKPISNGEYLMSKLFLLEEKHRLLKKALHTNLKKKYSIEMNIRKQYEELKKLEIALEKIRATCALQCAQTVSDLNMVAVPTNSTRLLV